MYGSGVTGLRACKSLGLRVHRFLLKVLSNGLLLAVLLDAEVGYE